MGARTTDLAQTSPDLSLALVTRDMTEMESSVPISTSAPSELIIATKTPLVQTMTEAFRALVTLDLTETESRARMWMSAPAKTAVSRARTREITRSARTLSEATSVRAQTVCCATVKSARTRTSARWATTTVTQTHNVTMLSFATEAWVGLVLATLAMPDLANRARM